MASITGAQAVHINILRGWPVAGGEGGKGRAAPNQQSWQGGGDLLGRPEKSGRIQVQLYVFLALMQNLNRR